MPPARELERALARRDRAGERALLVAEQLALDQRARDRAAIDDDERRAARGDSWCSVRAIMSLPVPVSPSISTVASVGAIRSIRPKISRIAGDLPDHLAERLLLGRQDLDPLLERRELELARAERRSPSRPAGTPP